MLKRTFAGALAALTLGVTIAASPASAGGWYGPRYGYGWGHRGGWGGGPLAAGVARPVPIIRLTRLMGRATRRAMDRLMADATCSASRCLTVTAILSAIVDSGFAIKSVRRVGRLPH
jgi:hypothetical protein